MLFVWYVLSYLHCRNDLFSNRIPLNSTRRLTCAYYHSNAFWLRFPVILPVILDIHREVIPMFNAKTRFELK